MRNKKILWISYIFLDKTLYKTTQLEVLSHLARRGNQVFLLALWSDKKVKNYFSDLHVISFPLRELRIFSNAIFIIFMFFFLPFIVLYLKLDFLIIEPQDLTVISLIPIRLFPKSIRPKIILDARTEIVIDSKTSKRLKTIYFNLSFYITKKLYDGITTITSMMKKDFYTRYNINPEYIGVWTSGVSTKHFNPRNFEDEANVLRERYGLTNAFVVFYHGTFGGGRGLIDAIISIKILQEKNCDVILFLLGTGDLKPAIMKLINEIGIQEKVIVHDPVDYQDVPKYIAMCDVGILSALDLPHWKSQCPLKILEYLSMEKVAILSDIPSNRFVIGKHQCGIYIPLSKVNPDGIAEAILYAYKNRQNLKQWGAEGRAIINKKYTWGKVAEDLENYLIQC